MCKSILQLFECFSPEKSVSITSYFEESYPFQPKTGKNGLKLPVIRFKKKLFRTLVDLYIN